MSITRGDIEVFVDSAPSEDLDAIERMITKRRKRDAHSLRPGQACTWRDKDGLEWSGTVERINRKTVTLSSTDHPKYSRGVRVPKTWVRTT